MYVHCSRNGPEFRLPGLRALLVRGAGPRLLAAAAGLSHAAAFRLSARARRRQEVLFLVLGTATYR